MPVAPSSLSRFQETEPIIRNGRATFGRWVRPEQLDKNALNEDQIITIKINQSFAGRPDRIAQRYYNSPYLEWVVVMFNRPLNPIGWPFAGTVIKIPTKQVVSRLV